MRLVYISWLDHTDHDQGWVSVDYSEVGPKTSTIRSVGYVVAEDELTITIAQHWDETNCNVSHITTLLKSTCLTIKDITL